jgi:hypothetical protein
MLNGVMGIFSNSVQSFHTVPGLNAHDESMTAHSANVRMSAHSATIEAEQRGFTDQHAVFIAVLL